MTVPNSMAASSRSVVNFQAFWSRFPSTTSIKLAVRGDPDAVFDGHTDPAVRITGAELVAEGGDLGAEIDLLRVHLRL